jgi:hypothetical protein
LIDEAGSNEVIVLSVYFLDAPFRATLGIFHRSMDDGPSVDNRGRVRDLGRGSILF